MKKPFVLIWEETQEFDTWEEAMKHPGAKKNGSTILFNSLGVHLEITRENGKWEVDETLLPKEE